jgi:hypothetical protein
LQFQRQKEAEGGHSLSSMSFCASLGKLLRGNVANNFEAAIQNNQRDRGADDQIGQGALGYEDQPTSKNGPKIRKCICSSENPGSSDVNFSATLFPKEPQTTDVCR